MPKVNPQDFLLNTDYEMDKIVFFKEGSFTSTLSIPHNLGYVPLPFGVWSTNKDFTSSNPIGTVDTVESSSDPLLTVGCAAHDDEIKLFAYGNTNNTTIYYRVFAFEPEGVNKPASLTSNYAKQFILNTDYNYSKLMAKGKFTHSNEEFYHNLGYRPRVMAWTKSNWQGREETQQITGSIEWQGEGAFISQLEVTKDKIKISTIADYSPYNETIYWRIYYDEA